MSERGMTQGSRRERGMTQGARHAVIFLFAFAVLLAVLNLGWTSHQVGSLRREIDAECAFNHDLAPVPVTVNPATHKAALLGVQIVADARAAWHDAHCPGHLPPPSPSFARWARFYKLPVR